MSRKQSDMNDCYHSKLESIATDAKLQIASFRKEFRQMKADFKCLIANS